MASRDRSSTKSFTRTLVQSSRLGSRSVLWGALNLLIAYLLLTRVGDFHLRDIASALAAAAGGLVMALQLASWFGQAYGKHTSGE